MTSVPSLEIPVKYPLLWDHVSLLYHSPSRVQKGQVQDVRRRRKGGGRLGIDGIRSKYKRSHASSGRHKHSKAVDIHGCRRVSSGRVCKQFLLYGQ